jgi:hypothetical protein
VTHPIPDPGFAGDVGDPDPRLQATLATYAAASPPTPAHGQAVLHALSQARLLVPIVALLESVSDDGTEKESAMATVTVDGGDGQQALLAFTGVASLAAWRGDARPAPVLAPAAARSALAESADTLLIDAAGPVPFAVAGAELRALAASPAARTPTTAADVAAVVRSCLRPVPEVTGATLEHREDAPPRLVIGVVPGLGAPALQQVVAAITAALGDDLGVRSVLRAGVQVAVVPAAATDTPDP